MDERIVSKKYFTTVLSKHNLAASVFLEKEKGGEFFGVYDDILEKFHIKTWSFEPRTIYLYNLGREMVFLETIIFLDYIKRFKNIKFLSLDCIATIYKESITKMDICRNHSELNLFLFPIKDKENKLAVIQLSLTGTNGPVLTYFYPGTSDEIRVWGRKVTYIF